MIEELFKKHCVGKYSSAAIQYNGHKDCYNTVKDKIDSGIYDLSDFISEEDMSLCISSDNMWTLYLYPHTPSGSYVFCASSYDLLINSFKSWSESK